MTTKEHTESKLPAHTEKHGGALNPFEAMDALFDAYFNRSWGQSLRMPWSSVSPELQPFAGKSPKVDVIDQDGDILVRAELPGVDRKDLEVTTSHNSVTIKGTSEHEKKQEKGDYYRCEIARGSYARTVMLPAEVNDDKARASFKDGVLELTLPKAEKTKRRSIRID